MNRLVASSGRKRIALLITVGLLAFAFPGIAAAYTDVFGREIPEKYVDQSGNKFQPPPLQPGHVRIPMYVGWTPETPPPRTPSGDIDWSKAIVPAELGGNLQGASACNSKVCRHPNTQVADADLYECAGADMQLKDNGSLLALWDGYVFALDPRWEIVSLQYANQLRHTAGSNVTTRSGSVNNGSHPQMTWYEDWENHVPYAGPYQAQFTQLLYDSLAGVQCVAVPGHPYSPSTPIN